MIKPKSDWGDRFQATIPWWIRPPAGCNCDRIRHLMNQCNASEAKAAWGTFEDSIVANAKRAAIIGAIPEATLRGAVKRRMQKSYRQAFENG